MQPWPWMVVGIAIACAAIAAPPGHEPFPPGKAPRSMPLTKCVCTEAVSQADQWIFTYRPPDRKAFIKVRLVDGRSEISLLGSDGRSLLAHPAINEMGSGLHHVYTADLNADGKPDYIVEVWSGGCGLGGECYGVTFLLSAGKTYSAIYAEADSFSAADLLKPDRHGPCCFVHSQLAGADDNQTRDGKIHSFWVYRLYRFDGGRLAEVKDDKRFPKWIWYTNRDNHAETDLLDARQKAELLKGLDVPK